MSLLYLNKAAFYPSRHLSSLGSPGPPTDIASTGDICLEFEMAPRAFYINPKQYVRIVKRRRARKALQTHFERVRMEEAVADVIGSSPTAKEGE